jgi:polyhydroxyalkanoate synthesis regulator phasin
MVEAYNFFEGSQTDINRRLLRKIEELENSQTDANSELLGKIEELEQRVEALENPETP